MMGGMAMMDKQKLLKILEDNMRSTKDGAFTVDCIMGETDEGMREHLARWGDDGLVPREVDFCFTGGNLHGLAEAGRQAGYEPYCMFELDSLNLVITTAVDEKSFAPHRARSKHGPLNSAVNMPAGTVALRSHR
jgi:hypothetical protein